MEMKACTNKRSRDITYMKIKNIAPKPSGSSSLKWVITLATGPRLRMAIPVRNPEETRHKIVWFAVEGKMKSHPIPNTTPVIDIKRRATPARSSVLLDSKE